MNIFLMFSQNDPLFCENVLVCGHSNAFCEGKNCQELEHVLFSDQGGRDADHDVYVPPGVHGCFVYESCV